MPWLLRENVPLVWSDDFLRADESPAKGWDFGTGSFKPRILSQQLANNASGETHGVFSPGVVDGDNALIRAFSPDQYTRVKMGTVSTTTGFGDGPGPGVRMGTNLGGLRYGYLLYVNTTRSTLYSDKVNNFFGSWEAGADGDVWELQVWGPPAATWLRGIRNGRILFTIKDTITPLANIPINGVGGVALGNGVAGSWTMTHFESGNLRENFDGDILPDLVPTWIPATATDTLMGQIIL